MHEHSASDLLTDLGLLALAIIWGVNFVVVKFALSVIEPLAFNALRFPLACLVLYWSFGPEAILSSLGRRTWEP